MPNKTKAVFIFANKLKFPERKLRTPTLSSWRTRATVSTGLHARRVTGLTVADTEESFTRTETVARWSREGRAAYEAVRGALLFDLFFDRRKVFR